VHMSMIFQSKFDSYSIAVQSMFEKHRCLNWQQNETRISVKLMDALQIASNQLTTLWMVHVCTMIIKDCFTYTHFWGGLGLTPGALSNILHILPVTQGTRKYMVKGWGSQ
jgi:hypothetical protein